MFLHILYDTYSPSGHPRGRKRLFLHQNRFEEQKNIIHQKLVDYYCDVFISCLDSHSDGTHSLQSIHWCTSNLMLQFSKLIYILDELKK